MLHKQVADEKMPLKTILSFVYYHLALGFNMMCLHVHSIFRLFYIRKYSSIEAQLM